MTNIAQVSLHSDKEDLWLSNDSPSYSFSVKSTYSKLAYYGNGSIIGHFVDLWNLKVMPLPQFYVWRALLDMIATKQNLHKRGIIMSDTSCPLCGREEESTPHILIMCNVSNSV